MTFLGGIKNKPTDFSVGKHPRTWFHPQQLNFQGRSFESFGSISPAAPLESIGGVHKTTSTQDMASSVRGALCKQNLLWEVGGFRKKCFHFSPTWHGRRRFPTLSTISACLESLVGPMFTSGGSENCNVTAAMSLTNSCNNFHLNDLGIVFTWVQLICRSDLKGNNNCHKFSGHPLSSGKWHWTLDSFKPPSLSTWYFGSPNLWLLDVLIGVDYQPMFGLDFFFTLLKNLLRTSNFLPWTFLPFEIQSA